MATSAPSRLFGLDANQQHPSSQSRQIDCSNGGGCKRRLKSWRQQQQQPRMGNTTTSSSSSSSSSSSGQTRFRLINEREDEAERLDDSKVARVEDRLIDLGDDENNHGNNQERGKDDFVLAYNAIKLTNYYTNLLFNKQQQQIINQTKSSLKKSHSNHQTGPNWRNKQLAHQVPHQDIKLLAAAASSSNGSTNNNGDDSSEMQNRINNEQHGDEGATSSQCKDEIKFIRGQRKLASQFKASLYYLSPLSHQPATVQPATKSTSWLARSHQQSSSRAAAAAAAAEQRQQVHNCFKCKLPIEANTTCVRVENLQLESQIGNEQQEQQQQQIVSSNNKAQKSENCLQRLRSFAKGQQQQQVTGKVAKGAMFTSPQKPSQIVGAGDNNNESESTKATTTSSDCCELKSSSGSSCDEGMGTCSSGSNSSSASAQSSTAGSHCDDRETPPHVAVDHHHHPADCRHSPGSCGSGSSSCTGSAASSPPSRLPTSKLTMMAGANSNSCDNLKLSIDSLDKQLNFTPTTTTNKPTSERKRSRSTTLSGDQLDLAAEVGGSQRGSRKALTWSASLSSFGASFKSSLSSPSSKANSKSSNCDAAITNKTILYHTDCFSCTTCNELLVDLRALIYVNNQQQAMVPNEGQKRVVETETEVDAEYVNLPSNEELLVVGAGKSEDTNTNQQQEQQVQASLYCHRHFVELFKPRCQQCDCLILDEECTEAEGKVWHIKHFCCTECRVPLGGQQYIIVDQSQTKHKLNHHQQHGRQKDEDSREQQQQPEVDGTTNDTNTNNHNRQQPYCLRCFDMVFGETCEECGKLITCDLGAINHEQRCWHASGTCFKCRHCSKSLLGSPFLPSSDGQIYCSMGCAELSASAASGGSAGGAAQPPLPPLPSSQLARLSLANYCDPRAPHGALQHQLTLSGLANGGGGGGPAGQVAGGAADSTGVTASLSGAQLSAMVNLMNHSRREQQQPQQQQQQQLGLMRHKPLIDYLLANARQDETSLQLLNYLYNQFGSGSCGNANSITTSNFNSNSNSSELLRPKEKQQICLVTTTTTDSNESQQETKLVQMIGKTLNQIEIERKSSKTTADNPAQTQALASMDSNHQQQQQQHSNENSSNELSARRNKLNPFLIDSIGLLAAGAGANKQQAKQSSWMEAKFSSPASQLPHAQAPLSSAPAAAASSSSFNLSLGTSGFTNRETTTASSLMTMMDGGGVVSGRVGRQQLQRSSGELLDQVLANYINLDCVFEQQQQQASSAAVVSKGKQLQPASANQAGGLDCVDNRSLEPALSLKHYPANHHNHQRQHQQLPSKQTSTIFKSSQCSPAASLVSNEGTISDHSGASSSSGVSTAPPVSSTSGSLKSHSPLSSTSSHSSVSSSVSVSCNGQQQRQQDHHSTGGGGGGAATAAAALSSSSGQGAQGGPTGSGQQQQQQAAQHQRHMQSVAATLERRRRVQPITELSVVDLLSVADDQMQQQQQLEEQHNGFDQLVSHFEAARGKGAMEARPAQGHQRAAQFGASGSGSVSHQESFFYELAQRLPRAPPMPRGAIEGGQLAIRPIPLDTNGLPTVESGSGGIKSEQVVDRQTPRTITDHYSTVNKATKLNAQQRTQGENRKCEQVAGGSSDSSNGRGGDGAAAANRDSFFAITSPLFDCRTDGFNATLSSMDGRNQHDAALSQHQATASEPAGPTMRPTSSLSVLTPTAGYMDQRASQQPVAGGSFLQASYSTSSLNRPNSDAGQQQDHQGMMMGNSQLLLQPTNSNAIPTKLFTKPAKSVSFDPTVKDPPASSGSGSMTLGRASGLKSALKSTASNWSHQNQLDFAAAHNQLMSSNSSATLPPSLANQLKSGVPLAAYTAHYDEQGRRIRLSSLLGQQQFLDPSAGPSDQQQQQQPQTSSGKSLLSGALSKLSLVAGGQSSRGGRREERKMRQQHDQQHNSTIQTQPMPNLSHQQLFVQPIDHHQQQHQQLLVPSTSNQQFNPTVPSEVGRRGSGERGHQHHHHHHRHRSSSSRHRKPTSSRRHLSSSSRRRRRERARSGPKYYNERDCYDSDGSCSTCSSNSGASSYDDYDYDSNSDSDCSSRSDCSSEASCSSFTGSESASYSSSSSRSSSRSSSPCSHQSEEDPYSACSSRSNSPEPLGPPAPNSSGSSGAYAATGSASRPSTLASSSSRRQQSSSSTTSSSRRNNSGSSGRSRRREQRRGAAPRSQSQAGSSGSSRSRRSRGQPRSSSRRSSRRSSRSSSSRSSSCRADRRQTGSSGRHYDYYGGGSGHSHRSSSNTNSRRSSHGDQRRTGRQHLEQQQQQYEINNRSHDRHSGGSHRHQRSIAHLQPQPQPFQPQSATSSDAAAAAAATAVPQIPGNMNFYMPPQHHQHHLVNTNSNNSPVTHHPPPPSSLRPKSPSTMSTDSKSTTTNNNENCRII